MQLLPWAHPPGKEHIPVFQDESTFHTNEYRHHVWIKDGKQPLQKKGNGQAIHVSDFITKRGCLELTEEQKTNDAQPAAEQVKLDACMITYPGKGHDAWWDGKQLVDQVYCVIHIKAHIPMNRNFWSQ